MTLLDEKLDRLSVVVDQIRRLRALRVEEYSGVLQLQGNGQKSWVDFTDFTSSPEATQQLANDVARAVKKATLPKAGELFQEVGALVQELAGLYQAEVKGG